MEWSLSKHCCNLNNVYYMCRIKGECMHQNMFWNCNPLSPCLPVLPFSEIKTYLMVLTPVNDSFLTVKKKINCYIYMYVSLSRGVNSPNFGGSLPQFFRKFWNLPQPCPSPTGSYNLGIFGNITAMFEISRCLFRSNPLPPCVLPCVIQIPKIITLCLPCILGWT